MGKRIRKRQFEQYWFNRSYRDIKAGVRGKRANLLPDKVYDKKNNKYYDWIFTLSPLDLVYVPTKEEIKNISLVDFNNLSTEQSERIYKYVDGGKKYAHFIPHSVSSPIWKFHKTIAKIYKELWESQKTLINKEKDLIKDEFGLGGQKTKNTKETDGKTFIKDICWKLKTDRIGNISKV